MNLARYIDGFYKVMDGLINYGKPLSFNATITRQLVTGAQIKNHSNVEVVDRDHPFFGRTGKIVRVMRGTPLQFRVALDNDTYKSNPLTLTFNEDQLEVYIVAPVEGWR